MSDVDETAPPKAKISKISSDFQHHHITPTLISLLSTSSVSFPVVVVPELAIPAEAYPKCINRPTGVKDYLCHLCPFRHSNLDSILTHIRKHLDMTIGCPICGRGYQNAASPTSMAGIFIVSKLWLPLLPCKRKSKFPPL